MNSTQMLTSTNAFCHTLILLIAELSTDPAEGVSRKIISFPVFQRSVLFLISLPRRNVREGERELIYFMLKSQATADREFQLVEKRTRNSVKVSHYFLYNIRCTNI